MNGSPHPPTSPPTHTKPKVYRSPQAVKRTEGPRPTPGLDSFSLSTSRHQGAAPPSPSGSAKPQMPSARTQVGTESTGDSSPPKPMLPSRAPLGFKGPYSSPENPGQMSSAGGGG